MVITYAEEPMTLSGGDTVLLHAPRIDSWYLTWISPLQMHEIRETRGSLASPARARLRSDPQTDHTVGPPLHHFYFRLHTFDISFYR